MEDWVTIPSSSNKLKQTYFQNFVDISGVMSVRNSNNINLYTTGSTPDFSINSHQIRVKENEIYYDISNSKLRFIQNLYENVQDKLEDLTSRTQYLTTSSNDGKAIFGSSIEISNNLICFSDLSLGGNLFIENYSTFNGQVDICGNLYANYPNNSIPISAITNLEYNLNTKSNLISPDFTGIPTTPTATSGTNTNQIATTAFVTNAVSMKADLASPTFTGTVSGITKSMVGLDNVDNTSDASKPVSTAQQAALDLKANLASPTFTGVVTAPTASSGTNTTQIATTAFVADAVSGLGGGSSVDLTQDISVNSLTVGKGSGNISTNSAFGYQALYNNTAGSSNVATGYEALKQNITGGYNVATGYQALQNSTTGNYNVATGYQALYSNTTSNYNVATGYQALYPNTTGFANVATGFQALYSNTTGYHNLATGTYALRTNTTGGYNIAIGNYALYNNTTGSYNVATGYYALYNITTGDYNTAFGYNAGTACVSDHMCAIGYNALGSCTTGYNVALGNASGSGITGGSYNTFIGMSTTATGNHQFSTALGYNATITASNQIMLGRSSENVNIPGKLMVGSTSEAPVPLYVGGFESYAGGYSKYLNPYTNPTYWGGGANISIHAEYGVGCDATYWHSDSRIKKNVVDVPDNLALQLVRDIPCRYYEYIDVVAKGTDKTIGFIAQEVKEVFPMAITQHTKIIPNEYRPLENISWEEIIIDISSNVTYKMSSDLTDVSGVRYRFLVEEIIDGIANMVNKEIIGNSDNTFTFDLSYSNVFCYGKEVDDFHTIDKAKIFALHHSAIQEIDRLQLEEKDKVAVLETKITELEAKNSVNDYTLIVTEDISLNGTLISSKDICVNSLTIGIGAGDISSNSVFGYQTLASNTTGYKNTAIGYQSGINNTTGSYNTAIGYDSGTGNNSGAYNTFVGASTNANSDSYNYSTALGYDAKITTSNQIVLGNSSITSLNCQVQTITSVSDARDKKNIQPLTNGITFVDKLNPVKFDWNMRDGGKVDIPEMGFIAQDLQQVQEETGIVVPGLVYDINPDRLEASYGTLVPILVKAIQDLSKQVTELKTTNATLQSQLNSIMTILTNNNLS